MTLREAWFDYKRCRAIKASTAKDYAKRLRQCLGDWMDQPIAEITKDRVAQRHYELTQRGPTQANVTMRVLRAVLNFALLRYDELKGLSNPVRRLTELRSWNRNKRRRSVLHGVQLRLWYDAVLDLDNATVRDYFLLLLFTGLRRQEAARLQCQDIDRGNRLLVVRDPKNGEDHTLPLSGYLYEMLEPRCQGKRPTDYIFPGRVPGSYLLYPNRQQAQVRNRCGTAFLLHDLRRTFMTVADSLEIPVHVIKWLANHRSNDVTLSYIVPSVERLRPPMEAITKELLRLAGRV